MEKENEFRKEADIMQTNSLRNDVATMKLTIKENIAAEGIKKAALPDIKETDRSAMLSRVDENVTIEAIKIISSSSKIVKGYKIFVCINGKPQIGLGKEIILSQREIYNIKENTMEILRNFDVRLTADMIKEATERLQIFSEKCQEAFKDIGDISILELYKDVVGIAMKKAKEEEKEEGSRKYYINMENRTIDIAKEELQSILDDLGINCSCTVFAKKLHEYDYITGKERIVTDGSGERLQVNRTGNKRMYRLKFNNSEDIKDYDEAALMQERKGA